MANGEHEKAKEKLRLAASDNHPSAIHELGCYMQLEKNYPEATKFFQQTADMQFAPSLYNLGAFHSMGLGTPQDSTKAFSFFKQSAKLGHARAQYHLGNSYETGEGVGVNPRKAFKWMQRAAQQEDPNGCFGLGMMYLRGLEGGVEKDETKAREWFEKNAAVDAESQYCLGVMCKEGRGGEKDMEKAGTYFAKAANGGHISAIFQLGVLLLEGGKVQLGLECIQRAAGLSLERKNAKMLFTIGDFYESHKQIGRAVPLYQAGVLLGHPGCFFNLGLIYTLNDAKNKEALFLIQEAANMGYPPAFKALVGIYTDGYCGVEPNKEEAAKWQARANGEI
eukprot:Phypoly_transcript_10672.p1 GENE.Phypoly_transcript_10672~~Phypoly_transcript_10672.p1  ORF type:complete len:336 (+),score=59.37 Phypoly_transcript_10672:234-1241(+)